jgi:hypothetical protein
MMKTFQLKGHSRSLMILVIILGGACHSRFHGITPEFAAIRYLRELAVTEIEFRAKTGHYGTLREVSPVLQRRLGNEFLEFVSASYELRLELTPEGYSAYASPTAKTSSRRSFFLDQSGQIRHRSDGGQATRSSELAQ